jgi:hypothetical protein
MRFRFLRVLLVVSLLCWVPGCCQPRRPIFGPQGTVQQQRLSGSVFDPFADNQAGPEIVGGRPREYQQPWSEAQRSRSVWGGR